MTTPPPTSSPSSPPSYKCPCKREPYQIAREMGDIATFMQTDPDNLIFRHFERLQLYNLLYLQHQLAHLAEEINMYEDSNDKIDMGRLWDVFGRLDGMLEKYHRALSTLTETKTMAPLPKYVRRMFEELTRPDGEKPPKKSLVNEYEIGNGLGEVMPVIVKDKGAIHLYVDDSPRLSRIFYTNMNKKSSMYQYSERAVRLLEQVVIHVLVLLLIAVPILGIAYIKPVLGKIALTLGCVTIAIPVISSMVPQSEKSHLGLVFGYSAVLVAFASQKLD